MKAYEAAFTASAEEKANQHLLQHFRDSEFQEDLCFALWRPSTGKSRYTGIIHEIILPEEDDRSLHGNVSFNPEFLSRALDIAVDEKSGLAFMHSHPSDGWQNMSQPDAVAEGDVLVYPTQITGLPLLGLTIGTDGYWSARFWEKDGREIRKHWCQKVRVVGKHAYKLYYNDRLITPPKRKNILRRTFDTWGVKHQNNIARMKVGIVGLGSVGCIVAEAIARMGVSNVVLIDPDTVEEHNLDRLLYGTRQDIGKHKVEVARRVMKRHATADTINIQTIPSSVHCEDAYKTALDCDFLFSCVDRPIARDILNFIAFAHLIPVIDGGVAVTLNNDQSFYGAHWRSYLITPHHQCLRCNGQYSTSDVVAELDGSLDDPSYVSNLPAEQRGGNQNVFPFSLSIASMEINMMLRYLIGQDWWPEAQQQEYQFISGDISVGNAKCNPGCPFPTERIAKGDKVRPHYIAPPSIRQKPPCILGKVTKVFDRVFRRP